MCVITSLLLNQLNYIWIVNVINTVFNCRMWPWMPLHILLCVGIAVLIWWYSMLCSCFQILSSFIRHENNCCFFLVLELWKTSRPNVVMTASIQVGLNSVISSVAWHGMARHSRARLEYTKSEEIKTTIVIWSGTL
jgi:hypothetical protein